MLVNVMDLVLVGVLVLLALIVVAAIGSSVSSSRSRSMRKIKYRTRDGQADYYFGFEEFTDGTFRIYILEQPSYRGRDDSSHATHRLSDSGGRFICWDSPIHGLDDAKRVAAAWANATQKYIRDGTRF